jgi:hypothetical protein
MHGFKKHKIPRQDDWPIELFIGLSELIEEDLMRFINDSRALGRVLSTFIALMPKFDDPNSLYFILKWIIV